MSPLDYEKIKSIAAAHGGGNLRLFGSLARGEANPDSDLDLIVDLEKGRTLLDLIAIKQDLEDFLNRKVDIVTERGLNRYLREHILSEAVPI